LFFAIACPTTVLAIEHIPYRCKLKGRIYTPFFPIKTALVGLVQLTVIGEML
jgi:hypothetical protein